MAVSKVTIAVSGALLRAIDREAEARGMSRSQWMSYATTATLERDLLLRSIDSALEQTGGPMTTAEEANAKRKLSRLLEKRARAAAGDRTARGGTVRQARRDVVRKGGRGAA